MMSNDKMREEFEDVLAAAPDVQGEPLRYTNDGALAECPCCGSLDVGGAHDTVHCYSCDLTVTKPRPLQNAIDAWNTRTGRTHPAPAVQGEPVGEVRFEFGAPSSIFAELYSKSLPTLAPGTKLYTAPQPAEQPTISAYACTVPDDCETLHWRGQILSMNELVSVAQPAVNEEIHVHIEGRDVLTLPLASSGMSAPRFVVHVPAQQPAEQQPGPDVAGLVEALEAMLAVSVVEADANYGLACAKAEQALADYRKQRGET